MALLRLVGICTLSQLYVGRKQPSPKLFPLTIRQWRLFTLECLVYYLNIIILSGPNFKFVDTVSGCSSVSWRATCLQYIYFTTTKVNIKIYEEVASALWR